MLAACGQAASAQTATQPATSPSPAAVVQPAAAASPSATPADEKFLRAILDEEAKAPLGLTQASASPTPTERRAEADIVTRQILEKYDVNHNGVLDPDERAALERDRAIQHAEHLRKYDTNHDGKLDENERAVMRADIQREKLEAQKRLARPTP